MTNQNNELDDILLDLVLLTQTDEYQGEREVRIRNAKQQIQALYAPKWVKGQFAKAGDDLDIEVEVEPVEDGELREQLAAIEHERWADWQKWCHKVLRENNPSPEQGDILERWDRQIETPYAELSEKEKQSDRDQVDRYWQLVEAYLAQEKAKWVAEVESAVIGEENSIVQMGAECEYCGDIRISYVDYCFCHKTRQNLRAEQRQALAKLLDKVKYHE